MTSQFFTEGAVNPKASNEPITLDQINEFVLIAKINQALSRWEFHDVRLRVGPETALLRMRRLDFIRAVLIAEREA